MPITILQPKPPPRRRHVESIYDSDADSDSSGGGIDLDGDVDMGAKSARLTDVDLVTPGELITDDPQWMRYALPLSKHHPPLFLRDAFLFLPLPLLSNELEPRN